MFSKPNIDGYEIKDFIGKGSFGQAYVAIRKSDNKTVALKQINYGNMSTHEKEMLVNECNILKKLRNDNIVTYYDRIVDTTHRTIFLIMEYCSGGDLQKFIQNAKTPIGENQIWLSLSELSLALNECHNGKERIIHRDIKPGNIFIDSSGHVKLGDFGLAKPIPDGSTKTYLGTPLYMSPELVSHHSYDDKSDIWALGCVIYEMAARSPPFRAYGQQQLNGKIKYGEIKRIPNEYSEELWQVIASMLEKDPEKRPSAADLLKIKNVALTVRIEKTKKQYRQLKHENEKLIEKKKELEQENEKLKAALAA